MQRACSECSNAAHARRTCDAHPMDMRHTQSTHETFFAQSIKLTCVHAISAMHMQRKRNVLATHYATHMRRTCNMHATYMQHTCNMCAANKAMQHTHDVRATFTQRCIRNTPKPYLQRTGSAQAINAMRMQRKRNVHATHYATHMQHTRSVHATRTRRACDAHAAHRQHAGNAHATHMQRTCNAHATHTQHIRPSHDGDDGKDRRAASLIHDKMI